MFTKQKKSQGAGGNADMGSLMLKHLSRGRKVGGKMGKRIGGLAILFFCIASLLNLGIGNAQQVSIGMNYSDGLKLVVANKGRPLTGKNKIRAVLLANDASDLATNGQGQIYTELMKKAGVDVFVLAPDFLADVPEDQRDAVKTAVAKSFDIVVAMDGNDVAPKLYNRYNTHSRNVNQTTDLLEAEIVAAAVASETTFVLGFGRGQHLVAAVQGMEIIQDIQSFIKTQHDHSAAEHELGYFRTTFGLLRNIMPDPNLQLSVPSQHHQAVMSAPNASMELAAMSPDGIAEAFEFKNGRGLTVQFQPARLPAMASEEFFRKLIQIVESQKSERAKGKSCESLLSAS
jgi:putative glutamine amidotransferase